MLMCIYWIWQKLHSMFFFRRVNSYFPWTIFDLHVYWKLFVCRQISYFHFKLSTANFYGHLNFAGCQELDLESSRTVESL